jgi:hypothetical protein
MSIELKDIKSGYNLSVINENFETIERKWNDKLDRIDPNANHMEQDLDMNSYRILNSPNALNPTDLVTYQQVIELLTAAITTATAPIVNPRQIGDGTTTEFRTPVSKHLPSALFFVNIDGITQRPNSDFSILENGDIKFDEAPPKNSNIDVTVFEPQIA